jgi:hypothetical protein
VIHVLAPCGSFWLGHHFFISISFSGLCIFRLTEWRFIQYRQFNLIRRASLPSSPHILDARRLYFRVFSYFY